MISPIKLITVFQVTITKFIDEDVDTKSYGIYSSFSKAIEATKSIKLNSKYGEYLEIRQITLDSPYPESPIVVHTIDSTIT